MAKPETPLKDGDEYDAFAARHWYRWKKGQVKKIKQRYWKRVRRLWKKEINNGTS